MNIHRTCNVSSVEMLLSIRAKHHVAQCQNKFMTPSQTDLYYGYVCYWPILGTVMYLNYVIKNFFSIKVRSLYLHRKIDHMLCTCFMNNCLTIFLHVLFRICQHIIVDYFPAKFYNLHETMGNCYLVYLVFSVSQ